nr:Zn-dependent hydrolase [Mesorhizobium tamadayense]
MASITCQGNLNIDGERLWQSLMSMAEIGALPGGGCRRLGLTPEDSEARALLVEWAMEIGCSVGRDLVGNLFIRRLGTQPDLPPVMVGSHLDTVATGGRFDGALGVLGGLEVMRTLQDASIANERTIELVVWINEEGVRFVPGNTGAFAFAGENTVEQVLADTDLHGISIGEALAALNEAGQEAVGGRPVEAYFELHVEQGPYLERAGVPVGIVTGTYTIKYFDLTITGRAAHLAQPLPDRQDALVGAAEAIIAIRKVGATYGNDGRSNASWINVFPNVRGTVAESVHMSCDVRHADPERARAMAEDLEKAIEEASQRSGMPMTLESTLQFGPIEFDPELVDLLRATARARGHKAQDILTVAGHDAIALASVLPAAMIFVPSAGGLSHNEREYTDPESCAIGADILLHAVLAKAGISEQPLKLAEVNVGVMVCSNGCSGSGSGFAEP